VKFTESYNYYLACQNIVADAITRLMKKVTFV
jgi:hypothetical protein